MAGVAGHAVDGIEDCLCGFRSMFGTEFPDDLVIRREWHQVSFCRRGDQGLGERQAAATCRRLQGDKDILRASEGIGEMDMSDAFGEAQHVVSIGDELL